MELLCIGGGFNARHPLVAEQPHQTNQSGLNLYNWYSNSGPTKQISLKYPLEATCFKAPTGSHIDFFLISDSISIIHHPNSPNLLRTLSFDSDHNAVEMVISLTTNPKLVEPITLFNFKQAKWRNIRSYINNSLSTHEIRTDQNLSPAEIDSHLTYLNQTISDAIEIFTPKTKLNFSTTLPLPLDIIKLISEKKSLRRKWIRNRTNSTANRIKSQINCLTTIITERIKIHYEAHLQNKLKNIKLNNNTFKEIKSLIPKNNDYTIPPLLDTTANSTHLHPEICSDEDKANLLGRVFESVDNSTHTLGSTETTHDINNAIHNQFRLNYNPISNFTNATMLNSSSIPKSLCTSSPRSATCYQLVRTQSVARK